jgi:hypothetical protein
MLAFALGAFGIPFYMLAYSLNVDGSAGWQNALPATTLSHRGKYAPALVVATDNVPDAVQSCLELLKPYSSASQQQLHQLAPPEAEPLLSDPFAVSVVRGLWVGGLAGALLGLLFGVLLYNGFVVVAGTVYFKL